jgi:pyocin large subunit-like protein
LLKTSQTTSRVFKSNKHGSQLKETVKPIWTSTRKKSSVKNAFGHWKDHGNEFPEFVNAKQYVEHAHNFFSGSREHLLKKVRPNGEVLLYDIRSNTFGAFKPDGVPKTVFKPKEGITYWKTRN